MTKPQRVLDSSVVPDVNQNGYDFAILLRRVAGDWKSTQSLSYAFLPKGMGDFNDFVFSAPMSI